MALWHPGRYGHVAVYFSDDGGDTFVVSSSPTFAHMDESTMAEDGVGDGSLVINMRNGACRRHSHIPMGLVGEYNGSVTTLCRLLYSTTAVARPRRPRRP